MKRIISIYSYLSLADTMAMMKLKSQANKLALSYLWWILEPLLMVSLFYVLFAVVLHRGEDNYFAFMIIGKIVYLWFSKSVTTSANSLITNKGIISQRALPKWIFPLSSVQEVTYKALLSFFLMILVLMANSFYPSVYWLQIIPLMVITYMFILGASILCSILVSFAQDFNNLINMGLLGLMFASGIFWDINSIADTNVRELILLFNPLAALIDSYRNVLMGNITLEYSKLIPSVLISSLMIFVGIYCLNKWNNKITRFVFS